MTATGVAMRVVLFCHSLRSDWNHGNAHFLRGITSELLARGHDVRVYEPQDAWSVEHLLHDRGPAALEEFHRAFPHLRSIVYDPRALDLDTALEGADLVLVHEWNEAWLVRALGEHRHRGGRYRLLFHDTHHRSVTDPEAFARMGLEAYDGVLAFGETVRQAHLARGWTRRAWTWHEAADVRTFRPRGPADGHDAGRDAVGDLVWVGNWGDEERTAELGEFLLEPVRALGLRARVHGVRYPPHALEALHGAGIEYGGWIANHATPALFARFRVTVHVPRRAYVALLPGVPTIRVFEALACGIPLVSAPWRDSERLFREDDFLRARSGAEMTARLRDVTEAPALARELARRGRETVLARHTCAHRVDELLAIDAALRGAAEAADAPGGRAERVGARPPAGTGDRPLGSGSYTGVPA